jgi:predicted RNase H-like HicB family nuclease
MSQKFTTVIAKEGKWFVAYCLELGVVSQGKTIEEARKNLREAVELYLEDQPKIKKNFVQGTSFNDPKNRHNCPFA